MSLPACRHDVNMVKACEKSCSSRKFAVCESVAWGSGRRGRIWNGGGENGGVERAGMIVVSGEVFWGVSGVPS